MSPAESPRTAQGREADLSLELKTKKEHSEHPNRRNSKQRKKKTTPFIWCFLKMMNLEKIKKNHKNVAVHSAYPSLFYFLRPTYCTGSVTAPLCCFTSASGQLGTVDGSWHLSTSQHPNRTSAERLWVITREKNCYIYASLPQIKLYFLNTTMFSGSWSNVLWNQWKNCHCCQWLLNVYHRAMLSSVLLLSTL